MKKLWKHEWKYYLFFFTALLLSLFVTNGIFEQTSLEWTMKLSISDMLDFDITEVLWCVSEYINSSLLYRSVETVVVGILVIKGIFYWQERDCYGREFLRTLPVTRSSRMQFHFLMDSLLVVGSVSIFSIYLYVAVTGQLSRLDLSVPWIGTSIFGETITCIAYLLFLLGLVNVLECIFVDGFVRIVGTAGSVFMCKILLEAMFECKNSAKWMQNLYGFFRMESPGGCYYQKGAVSSAYSMGEAAYDWVHRAMDYAVYYKGELVDVTADKLSDYFGFHSVTSLGRMVDFANGISYIGYLLGYLVLAFTLMGIAFYLSNKQEQSKQGFYFDFGRYLFCGFLCGCFTVVMLLNATTVLHKILIIAAAVLLFIILEYSMKPDRKRLAANNIKTE